MFAEELNLARWCLCWTLVRASGHSPQMDVAAVATQYAGVAVGHTTRFAKSRSFCATQSIENTPCAPAAVVGFWLRVFTWPSPSPSTC